MDDVDEPVTLVPLARVRVAAGDRHTVAGPFGDRVVAGIREGRWEGPRLSGDVVGPGGDWAVAGEGVVRLDVRQVLRTDDGATVLIGYTGRCDRARGTYTVAPTFETADPRYAWLNAVQAVGRGTVRDGWLTYEMYEVR